MTATDKFNEEFKEKFFNDCYDFRDVIQDADDKNLFDEYQRIAETLATYDEGLFTLNYAISKLSGEAGEVAEKFGKMIRDEGFYTPTWVEIDGKQRRVLILDDLHISDAKKNDFKKELGDIVWYVARIAGLLGIPLSRVFLGNLDKLGSRMDRGKLQGSGDDR